MITDIEKAIREYLPGIIHMSLATSWDGKPWVCEVHFVYDGELNLYFRSKSATRHCQEIADNNQVAGNIIQQHTINDSPRGVYFEGTAQRLENVNETDPAYVLYCERFGTGKNILQEAMTDTGHQFYKITVSKYYLFDSRESTPSTKYELEWSS